MKAKTNRVVLLMNCDQCQGQLRSTVKRRAKAYYNTKLISTVLREKQFWQAAAHIHRPAEFRTFKYAILSKLQ